MYAVTTHKHPFDLAFALERLVKYGLFTSGNRDAIVSHVSPGWVNKGLELLHHAQILTQANFDAVLASLVLSEMPRAIWGLHQHGLATQENINLLAKHPFPDTLISSLEFADMFTQDNFSTLVALSNRQGTMRHHYHWICNMAISLGCLNKVGMGILNENRLTLQQQEHPYDYALHIFGKFLVAYNDAIEKL